LAPSRSRPRRGARRQASGGLAFTHGAQLDRVGLTSTHSTGFGTTWSLNTWILLSSGSSVLILKSKVRLSPKKQYGAGTLWTSIGVGFYVDQVAVKAAVQAAFQAVGLRKPITGSKTSSRDMERARAGARCGAVPAR